MGLLPEHRILRSPDVVHRQIEGEAVLLDLKSGRYFGLNQTGAAAWDALGESGATLAAVEQALSSKFEVPPDVLNRDLDELCTRLESEGLIRVER